MRARGRGRRSEGGFRRAAVDGRRGRQPKRKEQESDRETSLQQVILVTAGAVAVVVPFLLVHFPPVTDLPQQVAQMRLLEQALQDPSSPYRVDWLAPNRLSYVPLAVGWSAGGPRWAGTIAMSIIGLLWLGAAVGLAYWRGRSLATAALAAVLFYNSATYWGFLSFLMGWTAFAAWLWLLEDRSGGARGGYLRAAVRSGLGALFLLAGHALWLLAGVGWLALRALARGRRHLRLSAAQAAGVVPALALAAAWNLHIRSQGFVSGTYWFTPPWERVLPTAWHDLVLGGLRGPSDTLAVLFLGAWLVLSLLRHHSTRDRVLLAAGLVLLAAAVLLPDKAQNTIGFAQRWGAPGMVLVLLGAGAPASRWLRTLGAVALIASYTAATSLAWLTFERREMSGMEEALARLPEQPRVLGLDFVKESRIIQGRPFLQAFAWAQVYRGGELNMSFAGMATSLVRYRGPVVMNWTPLLEWLPERVRVSDFGQFSHALVHATPRQHQVLATQPFLTPITDRGAWRLYRTAADRLERGGRAGD